MDYSTFTSRPRIRNQLVGRRFTLTDTELVGGITFEEAVNDGEEMTFGSCIAGTLSFQLNNQNGNLPGVTGKEFRWQQEVLTRTEELPRLARAARPIAACASGTVAYIAWKAAPYLSIWSTETNTQIAVMPEEIAPTKPVQGLVLDGGKLYCLHSESPWLTVYSVTADGFAAAERPELSAFQEGQIAWYAAHHRGFTLYPDKLAEYRIVQEDLRPTSIRADTFEYVDMGYFIAEKPEKSLETRVKVKCYDRMVKFDQVVDDWLASTKYPVNLKAFLASLCSLIGVELAAGDFTNQDYLVKKNFGGENITGRQVLQYIAEAAAGFCRMRPDGKLELTTYRETGHSIDNTIYDTLETAEYLVQPIDRVQLKVTENDIGVIVGSGTNTYLIENNPVLYGETDAELRPVVTNILNAVKGISYRPYEVNLYENPLVRAGDIFTITTRKGETVRAYIMSRKTSNGKDTYEATGEQRRSAQGNSVNQSLQALRGKTHELTLTVEELSSTISDANGNISRIEQTIGGIQTSITDINGKYSKISQTVNEISLDVNNSYVKISDTNGITVKAGGFRMQNLSGENVLDIDSAGNATFNGDISGSYITSDTGLYFSGSRSGGRLYGWSGRPSNDSTSRVNAATLEVGSSLVLYAREGVSVSTDPKEVAITNAGTGNLNVYGSGGIWAKGPVYSEGLVRGANLQGSNVKAASITLGITKLDSWWDLENILSFGGGGTEIPEYPGVSDDFFIESPTSGVTYKLKFRSGLLIDWYPV